MPMPYYQPSPMQNTFFNGNYGMPMYQQQQQNQQQQQTYQQPQQAMPYQQTTSFSNLSGRTVNNFSEITANDVAMTGGFAVFPKADLSEIEVRQWNANGTISARSFKPVLTDDSINNQLTENNGSMGISDTFTTEILSRLDNIEKMLTKKPGSKTEEVSEQ